MSKADQFAGRLKELRAAAGLSLKELAERAGITPDAIVKLESGNRKPTWETAIALADALGVSCEAFRKEPTTQAATGRGRPRKAAVPEGKPSGRRTGQRAKE